MMTRADLEAMDRDDPLAPFRGEFILPDGVTYLDGNSLGALPRATPGRLAAVVEQEWGRGLIRSWNDAGWIGLPARVGDKIGRLVGAPEGTVVAADSTSVNVFKLLSAALRLRPGRRVILSDTVGFISDLPTELVEAFRATLEEVSEADVILHVRDVAHPDTVSQRVDVVAVLDGMVKDGALSTDWPSRTLEVLNKADLMGGVGNVPEREGCVPVSAITGDGLTDLLRGIDARISAGMEVADYLLPSSAGARIAWLHEHGEVLARQDEEDGVHIQVRMLPADRARFEQGL